MPRWTRALAALLLTIATVAACSDDAPEAAELTESSIEGAGPISAVITVETAAPSTVTVTVDGPGGAFEIPPGATSSEHAIPVVGMRAESHYSITVRAEPDGDGGADEETLDWTTSALPESLPPVSVAVADAARMVPGVTMFNAFSWDPVPEGTTPPDAGYLLAVDEEGYVVWFHQLRLQVLDVDTTSRGTFIVTAADSVIQEIDLLGNVVREWGTRIATGTPGKDLQGRPLSDDDTTPIDIDSAHHEISELANGNLITLSTEVIELDEADAARLCPDNPEQSIVADIVVELSPDGEVVQEWPLLGPFLPAEDPGSEMCMQGPPIAPPNWFYPASSPTRDWTHANAIELDEERNTLIVSSRHLDRVIGLRYHDDDDGDAGEVLWTLGVGGTLELEGAPPYHQHAMELDGDDTMLLYDNGNLRPGTAVGGGNEPPYSRAVQYELDLDAGTARQTWEHRDTWADGRTVYTPFLGDVDRLPNDNVLITHGGGSTADGAFQAKIVEVVPGDAPDGSADTVVFDLLVGDGTPGDGAPAGWSVYRAERLASLYF